MLFVMLLYIKDSSLHCLGAAFTRFQTLRLQKVFPAVLADQLISYGSCQFPTLGFVVERYKQVQAFVPEPFWKLRGIKIWCVNWCWINSHCLFLSKTLRVYNWTFVAGLCCQSIESVRWAIDKTMTSSCKNTTKGYFVDHWESLANLGKCEVWLVKWLFVCYAHNMAVNFF